MATTEATDGLERQSKTSWFQMNPLPHPPGRTKTDVAQGFRLPGPMVLRILAVQEERRRRSEPAWQRGKVRRLPLDKLQGDFNGDDDAEKSKNVSQLLPHLRQPIIPNPNWIR